MNKEKVLIRKAFKFRLNITPPIEQQFVNIAGATRFVWNKALNHNLFRLSNKHHISYYHELNNIVNFWKKTDELSFIKELPSQVIQQKLMDLNKAFKHAFDKNQPLKRIPKYKKKGSNDSFRYPQKFKIDQKNRRLFLPKVGWVKYRNKQKIIGTPKNITISRKGDHWYASIQVEYETIIPNHESNSSIGIDMGIKRIATLSDGTFYEPMNAFRKSEDKLSKLQKRLKNKKKYSNNWKKQVKKISNHHEKIANIRRDYLHKISDEISKNHAIIFVEDLKIRNMSKSSRGDEKRHGKNVRQKSGLNKAILDQGWGIFFNMLDYKTKWRGGMMIRVPAHHTSQICPACNHTSRDNRKEQAVFRCVECDYNENADVVGAINIRTRGHRGIACVVNVEVMTSTAGTGDHSNMVELDFNQESSIHIE